MNIKLISVALFMASLSGCFATEQKHNIPNFLLSPKLQQQSMSLNSQINYQELGTDFQQFLQSETIHNIYNSVIDKTFANPNKFCEEILQNPKTEQVEELIKFIKTTNQEFDLTNEQVKHTITSSGELKSTIKTAVQAKVVKLNEALHRFAGHFETSLCQFLINLDNQLKKIKTTLNKEQDKILPNTNIYKLIQKEVKNTLKESVEINHPEYLKSNGLVWSTIIECTGSFQDQTQQLKDQAARNYLFGEVAEEEVEEAEEEVEEAEEQKNSVESKEEQHDNPQSSTGNTGIQPVTQLSTQLSDQNVIQGKGNENDNENPQTEAEKAKNKVKGLTFDQ